MFRGWPRNPLKVGRIERDQLMHIAQAGMSHFSIMLVDRLKLCICLLAIAGGAKARSPVIHDG